MSEASPRWRSAVFAVWLLIGLGLFDALTPLRAHELRPGYLALTQSGPDTFEVVFKVPSRQGRRLALAVRFEPPADAHGERLRRFTGDAFVERWELRSSSALAGTRLSILGLEDTLTDVLLRVVLCDLDRTLTADEANGLRDRIYAVLHEGTVHAWARGQPPAEVRVRVAVDD